MRALFAIILMMVSGHKHQATPNTPRAAVLRQVAESAVVLMTEAGGFGSGTVVGKTATATAILTCAHVVKKFHTLLVITQNGSYQGIVDKSDEGVDLAIVVVFEDMHLPKLTLATQEPDIYDTLYVVTSPLAIPRTASEGILYNKHVDLEEPTLRWGFTGFMLPGSSGGTITNVRGQLVCVAEAIRKDPEMEMVPQLGYCVGLQDILAFTNAYKL